MTGCSGLTLSTHDVVFAGNKPGVKAYSGHITGIQIVSKTRSRDMGKNAYTGMREKDSKEETDRLKFRSMLRFPALAKQLMGGE